MGMEFNAEEILQMAEQIEKNGMSFYQRAAKGAEKQEGAQLLKKLAGMEEEHRRIFARMRSGLTEAEKKKKVFDPEDQTSAYLQAWADSHVFDVRTDPAEKLTGKEKIEEIYRMAIGLEKDSIVFYLGMKEVVPERLGRKEIDEIIKEEMGHVTSLSREMETLRHQAT